MIRFKKITEVYPNGYTFVDYHGEDIPSEPWYGALCGVVDLMKAESPTGWYLLLIDFVSAFRSSALYPVMTSFEDWAASYSSLPGMIRFMPQERGLTKHFTPPIGGTDAGERIFGPGLLGTPSLYTHQLPRVKAYSHEELRRMLRELATLGGAIPVSQWHSNLAYGEKVKVFCSDFAEYLKMVYLLPPYWYLREELQEPNWLKLLIASGVLSDGTLRTSRGARCVALDGHECNSLAELEIDNWLHTHGIPHEKEPYYPGHDLYNPNVRLRADFRVGNYWIEYAGLLADPTYAEKIRIKKLLATSHNLSLIVVKPQDVVKLEKCLAVLQPSSS